jgi:hypothetical protein
VFDEASQSLQKPSPLLKRHSSPAAGLSGEMYLPLLRERLQERLRCSSVACERPEDFGILRGTQLLSLRRRQLWRGCEPNLAILPQRGGDFGHASSALLDELPLGGMVDLSV